MPDFSAETALSTLGIMPLSTTPAALRAGTSEIDRCGMTVAGSFGSRIKPGTSDMKTNRHALRAMAAMAAATSALQL